MKKAEDNYIHFPLVTVGEAARYLGVGRKIVYQLIDYHMIRAVRERGAVLIEKESLDELKASGRMI